MKTSDRYKSMEKQLEDAGFHYDRECDPQWEKYYGGAQDIGGYRVSVDPDIVHDKNTFLCVVFEDVYSKRGSLKQFRFNCHTIEDIRVISETMIRTFSSLGRT